MPQWLGSHLTAEGNACGMHLLKLSEVLVGVGGTGWLSGS